MKFPCEDRIHFHLVHFIVIAIIRQWIKQKVKWTIEENWLGCRLRFSPDDDNRAVSELNRRITFREPISHKRAKMIQFSLSFQTSANNWSSLTTRGYPIGFWFIAPRLYGNFSALNFLTAFMQLQKIFKLLADIRETKEVVNKHLARTMMKKLSQDYHISHFYIAFMAYCATELSNIVNFLTYKFFRKLIKLLDRRGSSSLSRPKCVWNSLLAELGNFNFNSNWWLSKAFKRHLTSMNSSRSSHGA